jgi:uncharacterized protein YxeA
MKKILKNLIIISLITLVAAFTISCSSSDDDDKFVTYNWKELTPKELTNGKEYEYSFALSQRAILREATSTDMRNIFDEKGAETTNFIDQIMDHYNVTQDEIDIRCEDGHYQGKPVLLFSMAFGNNIIFSQDPYNRDDMTYNYPEKKEMDLIFYNMQTKKYDSAKLINYKVFKKQYIVDGTEKIEYKTTFTSVYNKNGKDKVVNWIFYTPPFD